MIMKKLLGISLALIMLVGSTPFGFSEPLQVQLEQGIETDQLQCDNPSHVLVQRSNGNMACVSERTAEKMGWEIKTFTKNIEIDETLQIQNSSEITPKTHVVLEPTSSSHGAQGIPKPMITLDVPRTVTVGETFSVDYTIHWVNEHGKLLYPHISLEEQSEIFVKPYLQFPDEFEVLFDDFSYRLVYVDPYADHMLVQKYGGEIKYDAQLISDSFDMKLTKSMMYELDNLYIGFAPGSGEYYQVVSNGDSIELIPSSELDSEFVFYPTMLGRYMISYKYDPELNSWFSGSTTRSSDIRGLPDLSPPMALAFTQAQNLDTEMKYMPKVQWESFAQYLRDYSPNDTTPIREWLSSENMSEQFADDFLEEYPEFLISDTDFRFFFLPDVQAATNDIFFAYGKSLVQDYNGNLKGGNNVSICAYDVDEDNSITVHLLKNGIYNACKEITATDGSFNIIGQNYDEDDPRTDMDLIVGYTLENKNMRVTSVLGNADSVIIHETFPSGLDDDRKNLSSTLIDLGNIGGLDDDSNIAYNQWYSVIDIPSQAFEKLDSKTSYEIPFVIFTRSNDHDFEYLHGGEVHNFVENTVVYSYGTYDVDDLRDMPATLLHEYGHHVQHRVYKDSHNSEIPPCVDHIFEQFHSQSCGWAEGWAWFFAIWMLEESTTALGFGFDDVDFENALIYEGTDDEDSFTASSFNGASNEGWVTATLWDILDSAGESKADDINSQETKLWNAFVTSDARTIFEFETDWSLVSTLSLDSIFELNTIREDIDVPLTDGKILKENWEVSLFSDATFETDSDSIAIPLNILDELKFDYIVSSEVDFDYGRIYINDVKVFEISGIDVTGTFSHIITSGDFYTIKIEYYKDGYVSEGDDLFRINTLTHYSSDETLGSIIFEDDLNTDLSKWSLSGNTDWEIGQYSFNQPPFADNRIYDVATIDNCRTECIMEVAFDLGNYDELYLNFWYFVDEDVDSEEGLKVEISTDSGANWDEIFYWYEDNGNDNTWNNMRNYDISEYAGLSVVSIRFTAISDSTSEDMMLANVELRGTLGGNGGGGNGGGGNDSPVVNISSPLVGSSFDDSETLTFTGTATDTEDGNITSDLTWTSSLDGTIGNGSTFNTSLSLGLHVIIATVTDSDNAESNDSVAITIENTQETINPPTGEVTLETSSGEFSTTEIVDEATLPLLGKPPASFPHGLIALNITGLTNGDTAIVSITFPTNIPADSQYWKLINNIWTNATSILGSNDGDDTITISLTDGGVFDADGVADGTITDPGGIALLDSATVPDAPTLLSATAVNATRIDLSWNVPDSGSSPITEYDIFRSASPKVLIATVPSSQLSYTDDTVLPSTTYQYTISAKNQFGSGEESEPISVTTADDIPIHPTDAFATYSSLDIAVPLNHDTSLPLLVTIKLDNPDTVRDDVLDILLVQNDIVLPHVVESWDATDGSLSIWVLPLDTTNMILQYGASPQYNDGKIWSAFTHAYLILDSGADLAGNSHALSYNVSTTSLNSPYPDYTTPRTVTILFDMSDDDSGTLWNNGPHTSIYRDENISVNDGEIIFWLSHEGSTTYRISQNVTSGTHVASYSFSPSSDGITREFYVDGTLVGIDNSGVTSSMAPDALFFGSDQDGAGFRNTGNVFTGEIRAVLYSDFVDVKKIHDTLLPSLTISNETSTNIVPQQHLLLEGYDSSTKITLGDAHGMTRISTSIQNPVFALNDGTILQSWNDNYNNNYWVNVPLGTGDIFAYSGINYTSNQSVWSAYNAVYFGDNIDVTGQNTMSIQGNPNFENGVMSFDGDDHLKNIDITNTILPLAVTALVKVDSDTVGPIWQLDTTTSEYHDEVLSIVDDNSTKSIVVNTNHFGIVNTMNHEISKGLHAFTFVIDTDNTRSLYVDGMLVQKDTVESLLPLVPNRMSIGADYGFKDNIFKYYTGEINAVLYSDTVPTDTEIKTLHSSLLAEICPDIAPCVEPVPVPYPPVAPRPESEPEPAPPGEEENPTANSVPTPITEEELREDLKHEDLTEEEIEELIKEIVDPDASTQSFFLPSAFVQVPIKEPDTFSDWTGYSDRYNSEFTDYKLELDII